MGAGLSSSLKHHSISTYIKATRSVQITSIKPLVFYYGVFTGAQIYTWEKGSVNSWDVFLPDANWVKPHYKENPSDLFRKLYYGGLVGVGLENVGFFSPSLEFKFLPQYAKSFKNELNTFELCLNIGFGSKKQKE